MQEYQERVVGEKTELDQKLGRLAAFLAGERPTSVPSEELERMQRQSEVMQEYSKILAERIAAF